MLHVIIFLSSGLFVYWVTRTMQLLADSDEAIDEALEYDLWRARDLLRRSLTVAARIEVDGRGSD
jgi:hypothetical protein